MVNRCVALDTETTGLDPKKGHRLTEIGCVELIDRRPTGVTFQSYFNPERELDEKAVEITGLTRAFLSDKPLFKTVAQSFLDFIEGAELIIHNAAFDLGFLNAELSAIGYTRLPLEKHVTVIDTLLLAKQRFPGHRYYNLDALCQRHGVDNTHREYHGALLDADILAKVYLKMTAGQVSLGFEPSDHEILSRVGGAAFNQTLSMAGHIADQLQALKVVHATPAEIALHEARLAELGAKN